MDFILNFWVELGAWAQDVLFGWGLPAWAVNLISDIVGVLVLVVIGIMAVLIFTPMERKVIARMQDRPGPNRVWPYGLLQALADAIKMLTKEDITPTNANRALHMLAPLIVAIPALLVYAVLPWGPNIIGKDLNVGILFILAIAALHVIAIIVAGWGSNNKYSLLSAFRVVNQLLAYEIPMVFCLLSVILFTKTMSTQGIVEAQTIPYFIVMPVAGMIFLICAMAEANRSPVDLIEADSEMVAGYMIEYSGMKFAMFFIAEYVNMFAAAIVISTVFLGGYKFFGLENLAPVLTPVIVFAKAVFVIFVMLWFRATFPRVRFDHLVGFAWKFLVPLAMVNLLLSALVVKIPVANTRVEPWVHGGVMLVGNLIVIAVTVLILNRSARKVEDAPALKRIVAVER
ncbi:MAG: NADH-quinone oxidoreductase subunit NuoH [Anaerolineae bacterium]|jgi:NADH-quinone oxidoreductase subunit H